MKISHNLISRVRTPVPQCPVCLNNNDHLICSLVQPILLFQMRHVLNVALKQAEYIIHNGEQPNRENKQPLFMSDINTHHPNLTPLSKSRFKIYKASKSEAPQIIKKMLSSQYIKTNQIKNETLRKNVMEKFMDLGRSGF